MLSHERPTHCWEVPFCLVLKLCKRGDRKDHGLLGHSQEATVGRTFPSANNTNNNTTTTTTNTNNIQIIICYVLPALLWCLKCTVSYQNPQSLGQRSLGLGEKCPEKSQPTLRTDVCLWEEKDGHHLVPTFLLCWMYMLSFWVGHIRWV